MNIEVGNTLSLIFFICYQPLTEVCGKISGRQWFCLTTPASKRR